MKHTIELTNRELIVILFLLSETERGEPFKDFGDFLQDMDVHDFHAQPVVNLLVRKLPEPQTGSR